MPSFMAPGCVSAVAFPGSGTGHCTIQPVTERSRGCMRTAYSVNTSLMQHGAAAVPATISRLQREHIRRVVGCDKTSKCPAAIAHCYVQPKPILRCKRRCQKECHLHIHEGVPAIGEAGMAGAAVLAALCMACRCWHPPEAHLFQSQVVRGHCSADVQHLYGKQYTSVSGLCSHTDHVQLSCGTTPHRMTKASRTQCDASACVKTDAGIGAL